MKTEFTQPGTFEKPRLIGRMVRVGLGLILLLFFFLIVSNYKFGAAVGLNNLLWWFGGLMALHSLPEIVNVIAGREWGRWPQGAILFLAVAVGVIDQVLYGRFFGPTLSLLNFLLLIFVTGLGGLSSILAGLLAVPG